MLEGKIVMKVTKAFKDGKLLEQEERTEEIKPVFFPENAAVAKVHVSRDLPFILYGYGGNAKASVHISVPCLFEQSEVEDAVKYATEFCQKEVVDQMNSYQSWLDSRGIDWKKVDDQMKRNA